MNVHDLLHIDLGTLLRGRIEIGPRSTTQHNATRVRRTARALLFPFRAMRGVIRGFARTNHTRCLRLVTEQLRRIVACNAPLVPALDAILTDAPYRNVRRALHRLRNALAEGHSLPEALQQQRLFPRYYIDLVRAGENTGSMGHTFDNLIGVLGESERLHKAFMLPLSYFAGLLILFSAITAFLCVKVFPVFVEMLQDYSDIPVPPSCAGLLAVADFVQYTLMRFTGPLNAAQAVLGVLIVFWAWRWGLIGSVASRVMLHTPWLGRVATKANLGHIARIMEALVSAGYPLDEALDTATTIDVQGVFRKLVTRLRDGVRRGESLSAACDRDARLLPPWFRGMVSLGETSGNLAASFERIATLYEHEVITAGMIASRFVLPAVVLVMACWVFMVYSFPFVMLTTFMDGIIAQM